MGIWRGIARWIAKALLAVSIAAFIITSTGSHFSTTENLLPIAREIALSQISQDQITELYTGLSMQCQQQNQEIITLPSPVEGIDTIKVNCTRLKEKGEEEVRDIFGEQVVGGMLEGKSSAPCEGFECLSQGPVGMISSSFHSFLKALETGSLIAIIIFGTLVVLLSEGISSKLLNLGIPFLVAGLPYFLIPSMKSGMQGQETVAKISGIIFAYLSSRFLMMIIIGAVLVAAGIILKFMKKKDSKKGGKK